MTAQRLVRWRARGLYAITPEEPDSAVLLERVRRCLDGGAAALQYRAKSLAFERQREQASRLAALCHARGVPLIVNDSVELARVVGADGVHLGRGDGDARAARAALGGGIVGISCYNELGRVRDAVAGGADYVAIGSVFPSATKPGAVHAPLELLSQAARIGGRPVVAIGGITAQNAAEAIRAGADMVAVISAVFDAPDMESAARAIARLFHEPAAGVHDVRA